MFLRFAERTLLAAIFSLIFSISAMAQANQYQVAPSASPTPPNESDETVRVKVEEIQLNVTARNDAEHFDPTLVADDLMVVENRVPHSIASIRRVPASVLVILDTGGEMRKVKNLQTTRGAAIKLAENLQPEDRISIMQYSDKVEILSEWTDKLQALQVLAGSQINFGKRSQFVEAIKLATVFLNKREPQNRHLVLITDGLDSANKKAERDAAIKELVAANVSVHILSYTTMEQAATPSATSGIFQKGEARPPNRTPTEHKITLPQSIQDLMNMPRLGSITTDRAWIRQQKIYRDALKESQTKLTDLAADTGGALYLPATNEEMITQSKAVADVIDSQYVVTYIPKRPLDNAAAGEVREIAVVSRRVGLRVTARRKLIVPAQNSGK